MIGFRRVFLYTNANSADALLDLVIAHIRIRPLRPYTCDYVILISGTLQVVAYPGVLRPGTLAREHAEEAANLRALLNIRYEELFHAYYDQAVGGEVIVAADLR
jgi:hypothetical protein